VEGLESQVRALASTLDAPEMVGEPPVRGRGLGYVLSRIDAVRRGRFGERGVDAFAEELDRRRRGVQVGSVNPYDDRLHDETLRQVRLLGGRILQSGKVEWPPLHRMADTAEVRAYRIQWGDDDDGRKRIAEARARAARELQFQTLLNTAPPEERASLEVAVQSQRDAMNRR
jgi:hypothetical protein